MFIHDIIKIKYVNLGYLPNYPYHLISDSEMFNAFLNPDTGYLYAAYPRLYGNPENEDDQYNALINAISTHIQNYQSGDEDVLPDWVYSYMLGTVIGPKSNKLDIHDLIEPLGADNVDDEYTEDAARKCYAESKEYLTRVFPISRIAERPPTMFGEPHVVKSLRLKQIKI